MDGHEIGERKSIDSAKEYVVSGKDLIELDNKIEVVLDYFTDMRQLLKNALGVISENDQSFPRFVAKVGLVVARMDESIDHAGRMGLNNLGCGLKYKEYAEGVK